MFGMSIPATRSTSSLSSMSPRTTSLKYAGVSMTTALQNVRSSRDDLHHLGGADLVGEGRLERRREDQQARRLVPHQELAQQGGIEPVEGPDRVDDRVLGRQLEHHGHVAELEVGVDQDHRPVRWLAGQDHRQVGRQHRLPRSALGGEDRDAPGPRPAVAGVGAVAAAVGQPGGR